MLKQRIFLPIIVLTLALMVVGCSKDSTTSSTQDIVDKSIAVNSFDLESFPNKIEVSVIPDFFKIYKNVDELNEDSSNVVYGTVKEIENYDESGAAMTCYKFVIEKSYKGSLKENDMISVLAVGGYVRLQKYIEVFGDGKFEDFSEAQRKTTVIKENPMNAPVPKENDKYVLFLSEPIKDEAPLPNGVYSEIGAFMGRYYYDNDIFTRYTPVGESNFYGQEDEKYSLSEMENILQR